MRTYKNAKSHVASNCAPFVKIGWHSDRNITHIKKPEGLGLFLMVMIFAKCVAL